MEPVRLADRRVAAALAASAALALACAGANAEVVKVSATGFQSVFRDEVRVSPAQLWQTIVQLPRWWGGRHTYSGHASNLSFDAQAGGCWCERWGDGQSIQHAQVVLAQPERTLRMVGGLGPLQELAVQAVWTLSIATQDGKTVLRSTYRVAGDADAGLDRLAPIVDRVMGEQFQRLKSMAETGRPE